MMTKTRWEIFYIVCLWVLILGGVSIKIAMERDQAPVAKAASSPVSLSVSSLPPPEAAAKVPEVATKLEKSASLKVRVHSPATGWLRVRESADRDAQEVGRVNHGAELESLQQQEGWHQIKLADGTIGWVLGTYLKVAGVPDAAPQEHFLKINSPQVGWLRVREAPSAQSGEIGRVDHAEVVPRLQEKGGWYQIALRDGRQGWILGSYVTDHQP